MHGLPGTSLAFALQLISPAAEQRLNKHGLSSRLIDGNSESKEIQVHQGSA
jgi:hypothetical protein